MPEGEISLRADYSYEGRLQRFYAWVGFLTLAGVALYSIVKIVQWVFWANAFVDSVITH